MFNSPRTRHAALQSRRKADAVFDSDQQCSESSGSSTLLPALGKWDLSRCACLRACMCEGQQLILGVFFNHFNLFFESGCLTDPGACRYSKPQEPSWVYLLLQGSSCVPTHLASKVSARIPTLASCSYHKHFMDAVTSPALSLGLICIP